ncbi:MAG: uroporphyrinogen decarboxylase family protein [Anaerolineae bacterium]|jgi:hypothetical protein
MSLKQGFLDRFSGKPSDRLLYAPDLTLWYEWHHTQGTLPAELQGASLPQIARAMGVPVWMPVQPWRMETPGLAMETEEREGKRVVRFETPSGTLVARWTLGPDGDWWQTEYPVKSRNDLRAAVSLVEARSYVLDLAKLSDPTAQVGDDAIPALELPKRPYSELLHDLLGWSKGLALLSEPEVADILALLETKLRELVEDVALLSGEMVLSPDNLDGQFISPRAFEQHLTGSYRRTAETLHQHDKRLVVHVGGPAKRLLEPLAAAGVDGIEGISGPPQSDASLAQARDIVGPRITLWGGIPQDVLLDTHNHERFETAVARAVEEAKSDARMILGVADRVPVHAEMARLEAIPSLIYQVLSR